MHNFRCDTCKSTSQDPRNLVVFIDGTSNKFGPNNTNVVKLFNQVKTDSEGSPLKQSKNYWSGIGAQADHGLNHVGKINRLVEMAIAWNVEDNVKGAYRWLVEKYEKGAQIYLFGFSRGAYQVRVLAGLIHEVGLTKSMELVEMAYEHYRRIHTDERKAREMATEFKKIFCWPDVRVHFVGVWDTVSSVGLFKRDAFVSASASMTNACYFRHALALDERRVKFMPEYFVELNAHRNEMENNTVDDHAKEVWFAGSHTDVGGRTRSDRILFSQQENEYLYHAGHAPLQWMRREAFAKGLILNPEDVIWVPDDIGHGRVDSMTAAWWLFEVFPVRYQVSFSGAGKHERRWHLFQPRRIIPNQKVHLSVLSWDEYAASATLGNGIDVPLASAKVLQRALEDGLWASEFPDEEATTELLASLLGDSNKMLDSFERVLFLLESKQNDHTWVQRIPDWPHSFEDVIHSHTGFPKFASIIIYFIASGFSIPEYMTQDAGRYLIAVSSRPEHPDCHRVLSSLRCLTRHPTLSLNDALVSSAIQALKCALGWTANSRNKSFFPSVVDGFCNLLDHDNLRAELINWLCGGLHENGTSGPSHGNTPSTSRLSSILHVKAPNHLVASLRMIISLARHQPDICRELKPQIIKLAMRESSRVGSAAVEALVVLDPSEPLSLRDLRFSNVLHYLGNILPYLDVEHDALPNLDVEVARSAASDAFSGDRPTLNNEIFDKLVLTAGSWNARERAAAILTLLKLCRDWKTHSAVRGKAVDIFVRQLRRQKTSLLAAYALKTCLEYGMQEYIDYARVAPLIVAMLRNGCFDDAVGRLEGFEVFRGLMKHADLKKKVMELDIIEYLVKQLEVKKHHEVRPVLIILETLVRDDQERLTEIMKRGLAHLRSARRITQSRGVKILSALAQTAAGKAVVRPHVSDIVEMLLPPGYMQAIASTVPNAPSWARPIRSIPSALTFGPIATLYALCRNDELRMEIKSSSRYASLRHIHHTSLFYEK